MASSPVNLLRHPVAQATAAARRLLQSAVAWTYLATLLRLGGAVFVLPVVLRVLPPEHLGLWYLFGSLGMLANLLDLGFSATATRAVAYLWAGAPRLLPFGVAPAPPPDRGPGQVNQAYLGELVCSLRIYYLGMSAVAFGLLLTLGSAWIWWKTTGLAGVVGLRIAWVVYVIGVGVNLSGALWPALCAGVDQVKKSQEIQAYGQMLYYVVAFSGLGWGWGLGALAGAHLLAGATTWGLGYRAVRVLLPELPRLRWRTFHWETLRVLWPNAWRTACVSAGGYLILQANVLICSAVLGLETTASYGLSFQVGTILVGLGNVWVLVKLPLINQWRAQQRHEAVAHLFARRVHLSLLTYLAGAVGVLGLGPWLLHLLHARTTLLPLPALAVLLLILWLEMHHSLYACLVFTENYNPFLKPALISGVCIVALSSVLSHWLGVWGLLLSAGGVQACYNNWWPVWRAIRGLGLRGGEYWRIFLSAWR